MSRMNKSTHGLRILRKSIMEIVLVVLFITLACTTDHFFEIDNLLNILRNISIPGVIALGMTMVIIAGEIDLSVGSMVAFSGCVCAWVVQYLAGRPHPVSPVIQVIAGSAAARWLRGAAVGAISGAMRVRFLDADIHHNARVVSHPSRRRDAGDKRFSDLAVP